MRLKLQCQSFVFLLPCILLCILQFTNGAYNNQFLDTIGCSAKSKISLTTNKTLVLKLSRWDEYHRGSSFLNFQCKFQVSAPRGYGIMVTIQELHLRTKNMQSTTCRDYVKFENGDGLEAGPICGEVLESDFTELPKALVGPRYFYDPKGNVDVAFKFDGSRTDEVQKPFKVGVAFTAYAECTSTGLLTRQVRQCSNTRIYSCIASNLFCDGVINCGYRGAFGNDEIDCPKNSNSTDADTSTPSQTVNRLGGGRSTNTEIENEVEDEPQQQGIPVPMHIFALVSAISGAMVVLLILFICCCIGRSISQRNLTRAHERAHQPNNRAVELTLSHHTNIPMTGIPTAPGTSEAKLPDDLPPSYEAIFPGPPVPEKR